MPHVKTKPYKEHRPAQQAKCLAYVKGNVARIFKTARERGVPIATVEEHLVVAKSTLNYLGLYRYNQRYIEGCIDTNMQRLKEYR